jgi:NPCBM/NEW2 domain
MSHHRGPKGAEIDNDNSRAPMAKARPRGVYRRSFVFCHFICAIIGTSEVFAADVLPVTGQQFEGELLSIGSDGQVTFREVNAEGTGTVAEATAPSEGSTKTKRAGAGTRSLQPGELVRWGHPVAARAQSIVVLADGGRIVTAPDWAGGAAVRLEGDAVVMISNVFDEVRLPREMVRGFVFAQRRHPSERERLAERIAGEPRSPRTQGSAGSELKGMGNSDAVLLANGDRLEGKVTESEGGSLTVEMQAGAVKLPLSRVVAVELGSGQSVAASRQPVLVVGLRDGSLIYANAVRADNDELALETSNDLKLAGGDVGDITSLQSLGGRFVYLSDLEPDDYRHVPYLDVNWQWTADRGVSGRPLVVNGQRYLKGIGMHSAGRLTYRLGDDYQRFDAALAVDDSAEARGSVTFGVYLLRDGQWQEAVKSGVVRGGMAPVPISIDVAGAQGLTLTVDYADRGDELDRAAWLDARLVKRM